MNPYAHIDGQNDAIASSSPISIQEQGFLPKRRANSLVFVDHSVDNAEQLIADLDRDAQVVYLDDSEDGISAITNTLSKYRNVESVHILSHGDTDQIHLGSSVLSSDNIGDYQSQLRNWRSSLKSDADLLFYGCNIAGSPDGLGLTNQLGQYTKADIAASTDLTGSAALGGDWDLEYATGAIEAQSPLSNNAMSSYNSLLNRFFYNFENGIDRSKFNWQSRTNHGITNPKNPIGRGKVAKFNIRRSDPLTSGHIRAELVPKPFGRTPSSGIQYGQKYTYSLKYLVPRDWKSDRKTTTIMQWHGKADQGERNGGPPIALRVEGNRLALIVRHDSNRITTKSTRKTVTPWSGNLKKGSWMNLKFQIQWGFRGNGIINMFMDGKQVLRYRGGNAYNDKIAPYWKAGLMIPGWKSGSSSVNNRTSYIDDMRIERGFK